MDDFSKLSNKVCSQCREGCCRRYEVFLSEYDKTRIRKINKENDLFDGNYFNSRGKYCLFYNNKKRICKIHRYRPLDCRIYPYSFWFERGRVELWLDLKCNLSEHLIKNKEFYDQAMKTAKEELANWSEGEIFAYLFSGFDIDKFKKQVKGRSKKKKKYCR
jgi:Fe-S-cluster containining protein